ncbi:glycosyl transferase [Pedobacter sp. KBW06]|uniref:ArnT family glycosyltransferase n=1 Tax=Pedobacter sp. KBW06 TaxID=2153359 RepID=UPI000F58FE0D|nr:glycosyltransferase family 39 protein [Pedobacter sp. KBW06]RQO73916.1 glycosyl transferase [Pedobacter sp. KBW06]
MKIAENKLYLILIILVIIASATALFGDLMEPDGALYAAIAKTMVLKNDWINLYLRDVDWLDKPHLTFWLAAASYKIFGISAFAYKLPSFLAGLLGCWYLYLFTKAIYDQKTALISVLIFSTALHLIISSFDVRAETYITAFVIASIYHYYKAHQQGFRHIVAGSFFAACAIMIKGIFVLIPIFAGFFIYWAVSKQYKEILKPKWWIALLLILIFISPELYALYVQFDLHPEKIVFGQQGVSGLRFFFWDSQFGRFFNSGPIKGKGDVSFFFHTTLWAFLPWSVLFYTAIAQLVKKKNRDQIPMEGIIIWASALVSFLIFSLSKFQLPHYILLIFPQFSILTAVYLCHLESKGIKIFFRIQNVLFLLITVLLSSIALLFHVPSPFLCIGSLLFLLILAFVLFKGTSVQTIMARSTLLSISLMGFLYLFFYPALLEYQAGMKAGKWLQEQYPGTQAKVLMSSSDAFDFYAPGEVGYLYSYEALEKEKRDKSMVVYVPEAEFSVLRTIYHAQILKSFDYFHITRLKPKFLNYQTRNQVLERFYLVKIH